MLPDNRNRLTALIAAGTKLEIAERLIREADLDIASSGLLPREDVQKIAADVTAYLRRVTFTIELIPSAKPKSISDYLNSLVWDRVPRIDRWLIDYAGAVDEARTRTVSRTILIAAVRRIRQPGCRFDVMPVLVGPQGCDKSKILHILAVEDDWFIDMCPLDAQEITEAGTAKWIVETSELSRVVDLKLFLSRQHDAVRLPYQRNVTRVPRKFVVIGTTSKASYLSDSTGNRRFWPVHVQHIDLERLRANRDQLWAEAAEAEARGESIQLKDISAGPT